MHVLILLWRLATQKLFSKMLFGQRIPTSYNRFIKVKLYLRSLFTEGAIKKINFFSYIYPYSHLKTIGWGPGFYENVFGGKTQAAGSTRRGSVLQNPGCWEQPEKFTKTRVAGSKSEMFTKTRAAGSSRRRRCFGKQSTALADLARQF